MMKRATANRRHRIGPEGIGAEADDTVFDHDAEDILPEETLVKVAAAELRANWVKPSTELLESKLEKRWAVIPIVRSMSS